MSVATRLKILRAGWTINEMTMGCVTGKTTYESEELAKEALIQNRIIRNHRDGSGPINIYNCADCGEWHFTSKGEEAAFLSDKEVSDRIQRERQFNEWSGKFR